MDQSSIDIQRRLLNKRLSELQKTAEWYRYKLRELELQELKLDDPHALVPKSFKSLEEWKNSSPLVMADGYKFPNRRSAELAQVTTNVWQTHFHIVKCS